MGGWVEELRKKRRNRTIHPSTHPPTHPPTYLAVRNTVGVTILGPPPTLPLSPFSLAASRPTLAMSKVKRSRSNERVGTLSFTGAMLPMLPLRRL